MKSSILLLACILTLAGAAQSAVVLGNWSSSTGFPTSSDPPDYPFVTAHDEGTADTPPLQIVIGPDQTATFYIEQLQGGGFMPARFDEINLTGYMAIPEPSTATLIVLSALLAARRRR